MMTNRDKYVEQMKERLDEWNTEISALEEKGHTIKEDARVKFDEELALLRVKRTEGEQKLAEMQAAADGTWEQVKLELDNLWDAFKDSATTFRSHF